jgi:hypothetical protein
LIFSLLGLGFDGERWDGLVNKIQECTEVLNMLALVAPVDTKTTDQKGLAARYSVDVVFGKLHPGSEI